MLSLKNRLNKIEKERGPEPLLYKVIECEVVNGKLDIFDVEKHFRGEVTYLFKDEFNKDYDKYSKDKNIKISMNMEALSTEQLKDLLEYYRGKNKKVIK